MEANMLNTLFESRNHFTGTLVVDEADMHVGTLDHVCQFFNSVALCEHSLRRCFYGNAFLHYM